MPRWKWNQEIRTGRHVVSNLHVHLVFVTKYRRGCFTKEILQTMESAMQTVCKDFNATLVEFNGEEDHVHLLIEYPPSVQLSRLVNSLKGVSSRMARKEHGNHLDQFLWGGHLWSPSYFAGSCGGAPLEIVKQYIKNQRTPS